LPTIAAFLAYAGIPQPYFLGVRVWAKASGILAVAPTAAGVSAGGPTTPRKDSTAVVGVADLAPLETPHTAANYEAPDPSAAATPLQASEIAGVAVP
jgi:hypothetical protein